MIVGLCWCGHSIAVFANLPAHKDTLCTKSLLLHIRPCADVNSHTKAAFAGRTNTKFVRACRAVVEKNDKEIIRRRTKSQTQFYLQFISHWFASSYINVPAPRVHGLVSVLTNNTNICLIIIVSTSVHCTR